MNIYLDEHYQEYIRKQVSSGRFASAAEVVRDALREHELRENDETLRRLVMEAIEDVKNGRVFDVTPEFWDELDRDIAEAIANNDPIPDHVKY